MDILELFIVCIHNLKLVIVTCQSPNPWYNMCVSQCLVGSFCICHHKISFFVTSKISFHFKPYYYLGSTFLSLLFLWYKFPIVLPQFFSAFDSKRCILETTHSELF